ncbi:nitrous oxide reductase accessory protein NosL [Candidatus Magnetaquicoccus inordinatus]|uniref:nitrous oxide reductase accessory protein NosL n=1 Tax=Candidatus Magnetaquicoccus inordinatus TaxID=2496818 RepID=UPI00102D0617|nr:nitrous oxide reductase accessory protein NosL [Candidatus Magnetaquicoccus inordinatus]
MSRVCWTLFLLLVLSGCSAPQDPIPVARDPDKGAVGYYCGMNLREHPGPKGQLYVAGVPDPFWFSSVRDLFVYLQTEGATRRLLAIYVHDMGRTDWQQPSSESWMNAQDAYFVLGSRRDGGMGGSEIVPFGSELAAAEFIKQYGGRVVRYQEGLASNLFTPSSPLAGR